MVQVLAMQIAPIVLILGYAKSELFSAISDVEPLIETHANYLEGLEKHLEMERIKLDSMNKYLTKLKNEHKIIEGTPNYLENPINCFAMIKRLTSDLSYLQLEDHFPERTNVSEHGGNKTSTVLPTQEDLKGAAEAFWRLQKTYLLNTKQLANGVLEGSFSHGGVPYVEYTTPLTASDCYVMGLLMFDYNDFKIALEWFLEAYEKHLFGTEEDDLPVSVTDLLDYIRKCWEMLGDYANALHWAYILIELQPEKEEEIAENLAMYHNHLSINDGPVPRPQVTAPFWQNAYEELCRGAKPLSDTIKKDLKCYYKSGPEPFLKLAQIKAEQLLLNPEVMMFHDVISDDEIESLKQLAKRNFERSKVNDAKTGGKIAAPFRISKNGWLRDMDSELVSRISQRVSDFTGLCMMTAEHLQVANYGIGGHYLPHFDYFPKPILDIGNRIATVLFYMSDVEQGGATVFVHEPGLTVFPVKNSAIFWYNLLPSGEVDTRTQHAACPVLRGSKWVANKWIHEMGQEFRRPCTLVHETN